MFRGKVFVTLLTFSCSFFFQLSLTILRCLFSLLDSTHGTSYGKPEAPPDQENQLFGALKFPVTLETEAWKEKVS